MPQILGTLDRVQIGLKVLLINVFHDSLGKNDKETALILRNFVYQPSLSHIWVLQVFDHEFFDVYQI